MSNKARYFSVFLNATARGCAIAVLAILIFFLIASLSLDYTPGMTFVSFITLTAFALSISYAGLLLKVDAIPLAARITLHFVIIGAVYFFVLLATTEAYGVGYLLYVILYSVCMGISALIRHIGRRRTVAPAEETYRSRFS